MKKSIILYFLSFFFFLAPIAYTADYAIKKVWILEIDSSINPAVLSYLDQTFGQMNAQNGDLALIKMNTPGGLVTTTKDILTLMGKQKFPIVIWVTPQGASATSAGAIIASGAHLLYMSEGTNIGAATPIGMGGDIEQKDARSKAINDLVALVTALSKAHNRNPKEFASMIENANSFDARSALEKNIINGIANTQVDLLEDIAKKDVRIMGEKLDLKVAPNLEIVKIEMDPGQRILNVFANPMVAYVLFIIGAALIYFEMQAPGGLVAGAVGVVFLIMAAISFQVLPLNYGALALIVLSFVLFILEIYITSYGILSLFGIAALVAGSLFLYRTNNAFIDIQLPMVLSVVFAVVLYIMFVSFVIFKTRGQKEAFFSTEAKFGHVSQVLGSEDGDHLYLVHVDGEIWKAKSQEELSTGQKIRVIQDSNGQMLLTITRA